MSEAEVLRLRAEVAELRTLLQSLTARVQALENSEGFEVVAPPLASPDRREVAARSSEAGYPRLESPGESNGGRDQQRVAVAREIGAFLRRAINGEHRGTSGRDKVSLASRFYIVLAPYSGEVFSKVRVYSKFAPVKALCKRGPDPGRSVFVGLPSQWEVSVALEVDEGGESVGGVDLRQHLLASSTERALDYRVAAFSKEVDGGVISCSVIPVAEREGLLIVAVLAADQNDRSKAHGHFKVRLWIGLLAAEEEQFLVYRGEDEPAERGFVITGTERHIFPYGPSLTTAVRDLFAFVSAAEEPTAVPTGEPEEGLSGKVKNIEAAVLGLQGGLDAIRARLEGGQKGAAASKVGAKRKAHSSMPRPRGSHIPGLDPAVLAAARAAGVPEDQLERMGELARQPGRLGDGARAAASALSESEGEEEEPEKGAEAPEDVSAAICKMTQILDRLAKSRKGGSLEDLLDRGEGAEGASGSAGGTSKAAAYAKLSGLLKEDPSRISSVLKLMAEDYGARTTAPGLDGVKMTARSWLEHRSRVQQYAGPVRWGWQTATALDALLSGNQEECKARLCLMLCALDQSSLDAGNWLLAQEMHLEPGPPLSSFGKHKPPDPGEEHRTRIMDARWVSVLMGRLRERESYQEARKKLAGPRGEQVSHHLPGAAATPVASSEVWSSFFSVLGQRGRLWPMPVPYPDLHLRGGQRSRSDVPRKLALNATILVLSWLYLGQPATPRRSDALGLGTPLSSEQWAVVETLGRGVDAWNAQPLIGPEAMGRNAAKVESCEEILRALEERGDSPQSSGGATAAGQFLSARSCGTLNLEPASLAQSIVPERLRFFEEPSFDPRPFMSSQTRAVYRRPLDFARPIPEDEAVPKTQVRCTRDAALRLLKVLDGCKRLSLRPIGAVRDRVLNGLFAIPKDLQRDRMVLDARAPNQAEAVTQPWLRSMASLEQLQWLELKGDEDLRVSAEDLKEFYHCFQVEEQRICRNGLALKFRPWELKDLGCYTSDLDACDYVRPRLKTLAMGDCCAVGFGQESHLGVLLQAGALQVELVTLTGRPPREGLVGGLLIDDLAVLEKVKKGSSEAEHKAPAVMQAVHSAYESAGMPRNRAKSVASASTAEFWGGAFDGIEGTIRPAPRRTVPLSSLLLRAVRGGFVTPELLEVFAGSLVSIFQCRRRLMSVLDKIYSDELLVSAVLVSQACIDFRTPGAPVIVASDASSRAEAAVFAPVSREASAEFCRHGLQKGLWSKLLKPVDALLRERGDLAEDLQLPSGQRSQRRHINVGELRAEPREFGDFDRFLAQNGMRPPVASPLPAEKFARPGTKCFQSGLFVHGGVVGFRSATMEMPRSTKVLCQFVREKQPELRFSSVGLFRNMLADCHVDAHNSPEEPNFICGLSKFRKGGLWVAGETGAVWRRYQGKDVPGHVKDIRGEPVLFNPHLPHATEEWTGSRYVVVAYCVRVLEKLSAEQRAAAEAFGFLLPAPVQERLQDTANTTGCPREAEAMGDAELDSPRSPIGLQEPQVHSSLKAPQARSSEGTSPVKAELDVQRSPDGLLTPQERSCPKVPEARSTQVTRRSRCTQVRRCQKPGRKVSQARSTETGIPGDAELDFRRSPVGLLKPQVRGPFQPLEEPQVRGPKASGASVQPSVVGSSVLDFRAPHAGYCGALDFRPTPGLSPSGATRPCLGHFSPGQFVFSSSFASLGDALARGQGWVDLFSGSRGLAKAIAAAAPWWVLCFDWRHDVEEDLRSGRLRSEIKELLESGRVRGFSADPPAGSFSTALIPAWRSKEWPGGVPGLDSEKAKKVRVENELSVFCSELIDICERKGLSYIVANPEKSRMWRMPEWREKSITERRKCCVDMAGLITWTLLAEAFPKRLCTLLAYAVAQDEGYYDGFRKLDIGRCAKVGGLRVGEAANPGPRQPQPRTPACLSEVELVEPKTAAVRDKHWRAFLQHLGSGLGDEGVTSVMEVPSLLVAMLCSYAQVMYDAGTPLHYYRQLLAHAQRVCPTVKPLMRPAWDYVTKWERLEPLQHRPPVPVRLVRAMAAVGLSWGWTRWAATTLLCFYSITRIGEVLSATRKDLLTREDAMEPEGGLFLLIRKPKTRNRGARVQHAQAMGPEEVLSFLERTFQNLTFSQKLYGGSPSVYRRRWDAVLRQLGIPQHLRLTPGSLRGGGAVYAHKAGAAIGDLQWRMRLSHQNTLGHYLQETTAASVLPSLSLEARRNVLAAEAFLHFLLESP
ncbi:Ap1g1 [Symbiodinium sp. CCMP2456]|nr:Ap1g1 [Symbiodinium sp. CCMP2456]